MIVEVFKTNIENPLAAQNLLVLLKDLFPDYKICFDLEDCDKILRVAAKESISSEEIINCIMSNNFEIEILQ